jgi:hypothetical protein
MKIIGTRDILVPSSEMAAFENPAYREMRNPLNGFAASSPA